ncbi:MAG: M14 family zinc carboxypeptidase [candidate division KSB1 bacterium]|nr:M14 family zinc carboxypeptidase [candidate division KSB1 bacterium]
MSRIRLLIGLLILPASAILAEEMMIRLDLRRLPQPLKRMVPEAEIVTIDRAEGFADVIVNEGLLKTLQKNGVSGKVVIKDINAYADSLRQSGYLAHFHSPQQILAELQRASAEYPNIVALQDIGDGFLKQRGFGGQDIWAIKISDEPEKEDDEEADVLIIGNIHAREIITPEVVLYFMNYLLTRYGKDPWVTHLVNNREIWLIPTMNPEGLDHVFSGDPADRGREERRNPLWWRKNMRDNNGDGIFSPYMDGVDLNRNWGWQWGIDDRGSSPYYGEVTYRGAAPFSEPETQALRDFVKQHRFVVSLCYHSYSNLWLYPWGYTFDPLPEPVLRVFKELADSCTAYNGYRAHAASELYLVNGDSDDWLWGECGIYAFSPEVGHPDFDGFFPDTSRILPLVSENLGANLFITYVAGEEPRISLVKLPDAKVNQTVRIQATVRPPIVLTTPVELDSTAVFLYYRYSDDSTFRTVSLQPDPMPDSFVSQISFLRPGRVYYYAEAADKRGRRGYHPRGAPLAVDSLMVYPMTRVTDIVIGTPFSVFPNPFNSEALISFTVTGREQVLLQIVDLRGRAIRTLCNQSLNEGTYTLRWQGDLADGSQAASGIYYVILKSGSRRSVNKVVLLR